MIEKGLLQLSIGKVERSKMDEKENCWSSSKERDKTTITDMNKTFKTTVLETYKLHVLSTHNNLG